MKVEINKFRKTSESIPRLVSSMETTIAGQELILAHIKKQDEKIERLEKLISQLESENEALKAGSNWAQK